MRKKNDLENLSGSIREVLGTNHIGVPDSNLSRDIIEKQFNGEREYMRNLYEEILKKKCVEMGIDPKSLHVDWNSMKWGEEK